MTRTVVEGLDGYLSRLGVTGRPAPTLGTLVALHRAHLARLPYNNLDIMLGRPQPVDPSSPLRAVARTGRSGYCFHQNGALGAALEALGFEVTRRHGHVWTDPADRDGTVLDHLVLVVSGLPSRDNPGGRWWPDVGLGEGFADPLPIVDGPAADPVLDLQLSGSTGDGWSFRNDPRGSFTGLEVRALPLDVAAAHATLSTPPEGRFTRLLVVQRRTPGAVETLRGCALTRITSSGTSRRDVATYDAWRRALLELELSLVDTSEDELRRLFASTSRAHLAWDAAGRP